VDLRSVLADSALAQPLREGRKGVRFLRSFAARRLVHTNLQLLYDCNFRCQICDYWKPAYRDLPRLSVAQVEQIAAKLDEIGPQIVSVGGGEPLLHEDLPGVIRALALHHYPVMICNGWYVTEERARALWDAGIYEISISVDYADAARHDAQRGCPGAWERAVAALRTLVQTRRRPQQRVHMISVVMEDNLADLEPLLELARSLGVTYLVTLYSDHRGRKAPRSSAGGLARTLLDLRARYPEFVVLRGYVERFDEALAQGGVLPCATGRNLCNVDCQGDVSLCIDRRDEPIGNLLREPARAIEHKLLAAYHANECSGCWTSCRGNIETLMYAPQKALNLWDYYQLTKAVPLGARCE